MVPPRLARKMPVLSVDPPAPWAPGQIAAGRAHRPGSRRLGGVEAPGASPATGASWPGGPPEGVGVAGAGPGAALHAWGLCRPRSRCAEFLEVVKLQLGPGLVLLWWWLQPWPAGVRLPRLGRRGGVPAAHQRGIGNYSCVATRVSHTQGGPAATPPIHCGAPPSSSRRG